MKYSSDKQYKNGFSLKIIIVAVLLIILVLLFAGYFYYENNLKAYSKSNVSQIVVIKSGYTSQEIANLLASKKLIKSALVFDIYLHLLSNKNLQAGSYNISPNMNVQAIVNILNKGKVVSSLVTILPGYRIDQIKSDFISAGFSSSDVTSAFNIKLYSNSPLLSELPANVNTLEGLLWPDSFLKDSSTSPETIINESLQETYQQITPSLVAKFNKEGLSIYQALTLASIIIKEVSNPSDQAQAAQVFLTRLSLNMPLGSDVTALYGDVVNNQPTNLNYDSPYNTLIHVGLPPSPIATVSLTALNSIANPANTSWLYFVTGDNGTTYFSKTAAEQQQNTALYCHKLCQL